MWRERISTVTCSDCKWPAPQGKPCPNCGSVKQEKELVSNPLERGFNELLNWWKLQNLMVKIAISSLLAAGIISYLAIGFR